MVLSLIALKQQSYAEIKQDTKTEIYRLSIRFLQSSYSLFVLLYHKTSKENFSWMVTTCLEEFCKELDVSKKLVLFLKFLAEVFF